MLTYEGIVATGTVPVNTDVAFGVNVPASTPALSRLLTCEYLNEGTAAGPITILLTHLGDSNCYSGVNSETGSDIGGSGGIIGAAPLFGGVLGAVLHHPVVPGSLFRFPSFNPGTVHYVIRQWSGAKTAPFGASSAVEAGVDQCDPLDGLGYHGNVSASLSLVNSTYVIVIGGSWGIRHKLTTGDCPGFPSPPNISNVVCGDPEAYGPGNPAYGTDAVLFSGSAEGPFGPGNPKNVIAPWTAFCSVDTTSGTYSKSLTWVDNGTCDVCGGAAWQPNGRNMEQACLYLLGIQGGASVPCNRVPSAVHFRTSHTTPDEAP